MADQPPTALPSFEHLFREYFAYVLNLAHKLDVHGADAEDIAQNVFCAVYRGFANYRGEAPIKAWIGGICVRKVQAFKRWAWRCRRTQREALACVLTLGEAGGADPQERCMAKQNIEYLRKVIAGLPPRYSEVYVMHDVEQFPMREIAVVLKIPLDTGYTRLREARRRILAKFRPEHRT